MIHVKTLLYVICQNNNFLDTTKNMKSVSIFNLVPVMTSYLFEFFPPFYSPTDSVSRPTAPFAYTKNPEQRASGYQLEDLYLHKHMIPCLRLRN